MKRRISKRIIAIGISLCVAFSIMPLSVRAEAETAAPAVKQNNLWVSTGKHLSIVFTPVSYTHLDVYKRQKLSYFLL